MFPVNLLPMCPVRTIAQAHHRLEIKLRSNSPLAAIAKRIAEWLAMLKRDPSPLALE
jgi:hypothetical protein